MDYNDYDPGPTKNEQAWINRCKELEAKLSAAEERVVLLLDIDKSTACIMERAKNAAIDRAETAEIKIAELETELKGARASEKEAWEKRRLYFHERNEEATKRIAELETRIRTILESAERLGDDLCGYWVATQCKEALK